MDNYIYLAKLAEQAARYDDAIKYMTKVVTNTTTELTEEQIKPLATAYENVVEKLRLAWQTMKSVEVKEKAEGNMERASLVNSHRYNVIQGEIYSVCTSMLELLDKHLLPCASSTALKVFYMKLKGDYHRYLVEVLEGDDRHKATNDAILAYASALEMAHGVYGPTHPLRLELTLNCSVIHYEILDSAEKACSMAAELVMDEHEALEVDEPLCKESMVFMGHLRQNIKLWTSQMQAKSIVSEDVARYRRAIAF